MFYCVAQRTKRLFIASSSKHKITNNDKPVAKKPYKEGLTLLFTIYNSTVSAKLPIEQQRYNFEIQNINVFLRRISPQDFPI